MLPLIHCFKSALSFIIWGGVFFVRIIYNCILGTTIKPSCEDTIQWGNMCDMIGLCLVWDYNASFPGKCSPGLVSIWGYHHLWRLTKRWEPFHEFWKFVCFSWKPQTHRTLQLQFFSSVTLRVPSNFGVRGTAPQALFPRKLAPELYNIQAASQILVMGP